jgi:transcription elongation GreA/GreB family factor
MLQYLTVYNSLIINMPFQPTQVYPCTIDLIKQAMLTNKAEAKAIAEEKSSHDSDGDAWDDPTVYAANTAIEQNTKQLNLLNRTLGTVEPIDINSIGIETVQIGNVVNISREFAPDDIENALVHICTNIDIGYLNRVAKDQEFCSSQSPLGKCLIGLTAGSVTQFTLNSEGSCKVEVISIAISPLLLI